MNFRESPEQEQFRLELRSWLERNLPPGWGTPDFPLPESGEEQIAFVKEWQRKLHAGGWAGVSWPAEYGGRGASMMEQLIFNEEYARAWAPDTVTLGVGMGIVGPTLIACGQEWQKDRFLSKILTGEEIWCQGFSEPNAGSDLASLQTRGELRGDEIVVTGQKIWTSFAQYADWCVLVVRTDASAGSKHKGITYLLADMKSPGITIRPLREITGHAWFNELFFDELRVPIENVVGKLHEGWDVVITTLSHERYSSAPHARLEAELTLLRKLARRVPYRGGVAADDPLIRDRLARYTIEVATLRATAYRNAAMVERTGEPGPEGSTIKLGWSELDQRIKSLAFEILGPYGLLERGDPRAVEGGHWSHELLWSRAATIYAGTSEIQRNIIAERVLKLPR